MIVAVKNLDLWQEYVKITNQHNIKATLVKDYVGDIENKRCDILAKDKAKRLR